jgi:hypothetical protein
VARAGAWLELSEFQKNEAWMGDACAWRCDAIPFSLSATRVVLPGVVSETMRGEEAQIGRLPTTSLDPKRLEIADVHRYAGVIRDFPTQQYRFAGFSRSFSVEKWVSPAAKGVKAPVSVQY